MWTKIVALVKLAGPAINGIASAVGFTKPFRAGKKAAEGEPLKDTFEAIFDDAIRLLTEPNLDESMFQTAFLSLKTNAFAPEFLRNDYVKSWLSKVEVIDGLLLFCTGI